jgi:transcriptional regulator with XRE-family HTH domain
VPPANDLQARLRGIRQAAELTQRELGARLGCSAKTIANIEGGRRGASVPIMERWAEACGRTLAIEFRAPADAEADALAARVAEAAPQVRGVIAVLLDGASTARDGAILALEDHVRAWSRSIGATK